MATSTVTYTGNLRTEAKHLASGCTICTDAPTDNHGKGECFSPTDLVATALASCMLTIMGVSAQAHGFSIDGARAEVQKVMGTNPRRIAEITIDMHIPNSQALDARARRFIELAAKECPVGYTLHPDTQKTINFIYE
ncbi:MAG: OsmC family protein [Bacteroidales bacterium]|nr:OsmC family protein [Bacteroidales bacterium]